MDRFDLYLTPELRRATLMAAQAADISPGALIRQALAAELRRRAKPATTPNRAEEQLLGPLRVLLAQDFAAAQSWGDLTSRLRAKGYMLIEAGGGLALHSHPEGLRLCKASELRHSCGSLMRRFGQPFSAAPANLYTAQRISPPPCIQDGGDDDDDDFQVIEED